MSPAQQVANVANAQHSTGPRTEAGKAASSQNATKLGLFSLYAELSESLRRELVPVGNLESLLVDEIRRATWRLRRCGETEAAMLETCAASVEDVPVPDALQIEATAKLQHSVDRARAQSHRLLHKCTAELRKLQTERLFRLTELGDKVDCSFMGLCDFRVVRKSLDESVAGTLRNSKLVALKDENALVHEYANSGIVTDDMLDMFHSEFSTTKQTREHPGTSRNARCTCGSGLKYKRCCALKAAA